MSALVHAHALTQVCATAKSQNLAHLMVPLLLLQTLLQGKHVRRP
jgi:hypothetical protein